jgi:hypothetical protein
MDQHSGFSRTPFFVIAVSFPQKRYFTRCFLRTGSYSSQSEK